MPNFLLIDTAGPHAFTAICRDGRIIAERSNSEQKEHASFLQPAIAALLAETGMNWKDLHAISVSNGPGSYTGLRVGLAAAKGLCFAQNIPLLCLSTLEIMAEAAISAYRDEFGDPGDALFVPMIDARRMEVYTAAYTKDRVELSPPQALILELNSYSELLDAHKVHFFGNGAPKWQNIANHPQAAFISLLPGLAEAMCRLTGAYYDNAAFADVAYSEPFYIKSFHDTRKPIGNE